MELKQQKLLDQVLAAKENEEDEIYGHLIDVERELSKYVPITMSVLDETMNLEDMNSGPLVLLREYKRLLG